MKPQIEILGITIKAFGAMMTLAFAAAMVALERVTAERGLPRHWPIEGTLVGLVAGIIGARGYVIVQDAGDISLTDALGSGGGMAWYGGLVAGAAAVALWRAWRGVPPLVAADGAALALPLAQGIGRIGCQLAGDGDYGTPSDLPWAMGYPHGTVPTPPGVQVHPTPVYETIVLFALAWVLWRNRHALCDGALFGLYLIGAGTERFIVELVRRNDDVLGTLSAAQLQSLGAITVGAVLLGVLTRGERPLRVHRVLAGGAPAPAD